MAPCSVLLHKSLSVTVRHITHVCYTAHSSQHTFVTCVLFCFFLYSMCILWWNNRNHFSHRVVAVTPSEADLVIFGHKSMLATPCDIHHTWARLIFNFFHLHRNKKKKKNAVLFFKDCTYRWQKSAFAFGFYRDHLLYQRDSRHACITSAFMVICLLRWKCVLRANWPQYGIKQASNVTGAVLITLPCNNNIRNHINGEDGSCCGPGRVSGGGNIFKMRWNVIWMEDRGEGEMFWGKWSKHLSPTKEMSDPVNLIWMAACWRGFNFTQAHAR